MEKEMREIIAHQEQQPAAGGMLTHAQRKWYDEARANIDFGEAAGFLTPNLPADSEIVLPANLRTAESSLNASQQLERMHDELKGFFGKEIPIAPIPAPLLEAQKVLEGEGYGIFDHIYFPAIEFTQGSGYPGWKVEPENWYWEQVRKSRVSKDAARLGGYHGLLDRSIRPSYTGGTQMFDQDPLAPILQDGRRGKLQQGKIRIPNYLRNIPDTSRFGVSAIEYDRVVFPELTRRTKLSEGVSKGLVEVRMPTEMELNYAGNLRYAHFGQADTWEWMQDKFEDGSRLIGGYSDLGGLADVLYNVVGHRHDGIAARPLIVFPSKT